MDQFHRTGDCLASSFRLVGLVGVDFVVSDSGLFVIEVNPRYTASVEVLEQALGRSLLTDHLIACQLTRPRNADDGTFDGVSLEFAADVSKAEVQNEVAHGQASDCFGKAILFAKAGLTVTEAFCEYVDQTNTSRVWRPLADLPRVGTHIESGHPVITIRAVGSTPIDTERHLRVLLSQVESQLYKRTAGP
jgi:predicted ATP-grasp superfamily ATP-dependent carboligase